jgi:hypothetical protein
MKMRFRPYIIMTLLKKGEQVTLKSIVYFKHGWVHILAQS